MTTGVPEVEAAAGLAVRGTASVAGAAAARAELAAAGVPGLLVEKDPTLWGDAAEATARARLGWVDTFRRSRTLLPALARLREECSDLDHVVLAGMGGSSLAAEVICRTLGVGLTVLDTTDPHQVRAALADRLDRTVVVVSSKSGSTVETDAARRAYWRAFEDGGLRPIGRRLVVVTDPGSPLARTAGQLGAHLVLADPEVGGRFSALTAFGLVPAALAGVDVAELLDQAEELSASLGRTTDNPALALGAGLAGAALASVDAPGAAGAPPAGAAGMARDTVALVDDGTGITGLADWVEQLLAESTGKDGRGVLPVVVETPTSPGATGEDVLTVTLGGALPPAMPPGGGVRPHLSVNGPLGAQFLTWEAATALAARLLGVNPFDEPNVTESKLNTEKLLAEDAPPEPALFVDGALTVYGDGPPGVETVTDALLWLVGAAGPHGYLAVLAYLDRFGDADAARLRPALAAAGRGRPVTFGWGPRYLHSTGQYHKGGPPVGVFLQVTGAVATDVDVPGRPYTFGRLQAAQAAGDRLALVGRGRPVLRVHLTDRAAGLAQLLAAAEALGAQPLGTGTR